jgi:hypothetical protein
MALVALPQSASAQAGEADTASEQNLQEPTPSSEPATEEPALQLKLDAAAVEVVPSPARTALEEGIRLRAGVKRAKIGLYVSAGVLVVGSSFVIAGTVGDCFLLFDSDPPKKCDPLYIAGLTVWGGGAVGMIISGALLGVRKRKLRRLWEPRYETSRRVQWDLAQSRLVF